MIVALLGLALAASSAPAPICAPIPGATDILKNLGIHWIIAGETHGTVETPAAFGDLVYAISQLRHHVEVGLEYPVSEQSNIDTFLSSDGRNTAREKLLSSPFWHWDNDGRTSVAFLGMIERLRLMKVANQIDGIFAFQPVTSGHMPPDEYEKAMARKIEAAGTAQGGTVVVLVGNIHARTQPWTIHSSGESYMPMAGLLPRERTTTLNITGNGGSAWTCTLGSPAEPPSKLDCGEHKLPVPKNSYPLGIVPIGAASAPYSAYFNLGSSTTASYPAAR